MILPVGAYTDIVFLSSDPPDIRHGKKQDSPLGFKNESCRVITPARHGLVVDAIFMSNGELIPGSLKSLLQSLSCERLQKIVNSIDFKGADCILIVGCCKDDLRKTHLRDRG